MKYILLLLAIGGCWRPASELNSKENLQTEATWETLGWMKDKDLCDDIGVKPKKEFWSGCEGKGMPNLMTVECFPNDPDHHKTACIAFFEKNFNMRITCTLQGCEFPL